MDLKQITDDIIDGKRLNKEEAEAFLPSADLKELTAGADRIRSALCGDYVELCSIINGRSGRCSEDCRFCAQSGHNHTGCSSYEFLDQEEILRAAQENADGHVDRFAIVTSGRALSGEEFEKALDVYRELHRRGEIELCASFGLLDDEQFQRLKEAGVTRYHCNIETSRRYFPQICTTHTYDDKIRTIRRAQKAGLTVCSGGIMGMGESWEDRIDMGLDLEALGIRSIPVNVLVPVKGTGMEGRKPLTEDEIMRCMAVFRYLVPEAQIRLAGGRPLMKNFGLQAFSSGANASITGNMLTTGGSTILRDRQMLTGIGRTVSRQDED